MTIRFCPEPLPTPLDDLLLADYFSPGDRHLRTIEFCLQVQLCHELFRVDLFRKVVNEVQHFLFVHAESPLFKYTATTILFQPALLTECALTPKSSGQRPFRNSPRSSDGRGAGGEGRAWVWADSGPSEARFRPSAPRKTEEAGAVAKALRRPLDISRRHDIPQIWWLSPFPSFSVRFRPLFPPVFRLRNCTCPPALRHESCASAR